MKPTFFATPAEFRAWLSKHHAGESELLVGFHKKDSGRASITWPESVDEALCYGWIDGVRRSLGATSYVIRFTPRKAGSTWSAVNIRRAKALIAGGRMRTKGLSAFQARTAKRSGIYSYEQRSAELPPAYAARFRKDAAAWSFFLAQPAWYRKTACWFVTSAKKEGTRDARLERLTAVSARSEWLPQYIRTPAKPPITGVSARSRKGKR